jgi:hypothetical protein
LRQAYDYWQDQPGNSCNKENKLQKKTLEICALYSSLQLHKGTADQESVNELIDLSFLIDHVDQYIMTVEAKELLPTSLFDATSYCQSFFFSQRLQWKWWMNTIFIATSLMEESSHSHISKDGYCILTAPDWFVIFMPIGYQYTQVCLLPALRSAALALEGWSLNVNDLEDWMQTPNLASNTYSSAVGIDTALVGLGPSLLASTSGTR